MIMIASDLPPAIPALYSPASAFYGQSQHTLLVVGSAGTGGITGISFNCQRYGYAPSCIEKTLLTINVSNLMESIQIGFERVMSHLPAIFGVSRQTLYNWRNGETPKQQHQEKIRQLAKAALIFTDAGFKPTPVMLDRTVVDGQSFIDLLKHNADGASSAHKLINIINGGLQERAKLHQILGSRKIKPLNALDIGRPFFDESA